jgi:hypothetical protein
MPLTSKGHEIMANLKAEYGEQHGESVFYAMRNSGQITGVDDGEAPPAYILTSSVPAVLTAAQVNIENRRYWAGSGRW